MPIIRSSRLLYSGCCLWYYVLRFSSCWSGVELRVMCPVCRIKSHQIHNTKLHSITKLYTVSTFGLIGAAWQLIGLPTYRGAKMSLEYWVLVISRFHTPKNFRKLSEIWARALTQVQQPCPRPKNFKGYWFAWAPNYLLARGAHKWRVGPGSYLVLWWALPASWL